MVIPNAIDGRRVTRVGNEAFSGCMSLTGIVIPDSVISIGAVAFADCTSLAAIAVDPLNTAYGSVDGVLFDRRRTILVACPAGKSGSYAIPDGVRNIGYGAFWGCRGLTAIDIPGSVGSLGQFAFAGCSRLSAAVIPDGVQEIPYATFGSCASLTSVTIPEGVVRIGEFAFGECRNLKAVMIPSSVTSLGLAAFGACASLAQAYFEGDAPRVVDGQPAFGYPTTIYYLAGTSGWGPTFSGRPAVSGWPNSVSAKIEAQDKSTGYVRINGLGVNLASQPLWDFGDGAVFRSWFPATHIYAEPRSNYIVRVTGSFTDDTSAYTTVPVTFLSPRRQQTITWLSPASQTLEVGKPYTVEVVASSSLPVTVSLVSGPATLLDRLLTVTGAGMVVLRAEQAGDEIWLPVSVDERFGTSRLQTDFAAHGTLIIRRGEVCPEGALIIPDRIGGRKVTGIADYAFFGCTRLTSVTIPSSITTIGYLAFDRCMALTAAYFAGNAPVSRDRFPTFGNPTTIYFTVGTSGWGTTFSGRPTTLWWPESSFMVNPDQTATINGGCFRGALLIPATVGGRRVSAIRDGAFAGCVDLTRITLPDGLMTIGERAFSGCARLTAITIPDGVVSIGPRAFIGCRSLADAYFKGSPPNIAEGQPFEAPTKIYYRVGATGWGPTFSGCPTARRWPDNAFAVNADGTVTVTGGCDSGGLEIPDTIDGASVMIPDSVTTLGESAFAGCTGLTGVTIPDGVTSLGSYSFSGCSSLTRVYFEGNAPETSSSPFWETQAILHYLPGTKGWSSAFADRPTAPRVRPNPTILDFGDRFGPTTNGFSFVISWSTNLPVVVEASPEIGGQSWTQISMNTLTNGWGQFIDPDWQSQPARFYRVREQ